MGNQHSSFEFDSTEPMFRDIQEIKNNENILKALIEWVAELHLSSNDVNLYFELFLKKLEQLINFWAHLQKVSNRQKNLLNKPWLTSGILKSIEIKNWLHKRMYRAKDLLNKEELAEKLKIIKTLYLRSFSIQLKFPRGQKIPPDFRNKHAQSWHLKNRAAKDERKKKLRIFNFLGGFSGKKSYQPIQFK